MLMSTSCARLTRAETPGSHVLVNGPGKVIKSDFKLPAPDLPSIVVQLGLLICALNSSHRFR